MPPMIRGLILFLTSVLSASGALAQLPAESDASKASAAKPSEAPAEWNETRVNARIRRTEESKDLKPEEKLKILEVYKSFQSNMKSADDWVKRGESMERLAESAPADAARLRQDAKTTAGMDPMAGVQDRSLKGLEAQFKQA